MTVWQITVSAVQGVILLSAGEVRETTGELPLVCSLLHEEFEYVCICLLKCAFFFGRSFP